MTISWIILFVLSIYQQDMDFRDVNGTRFSRVPKKFPVPGKKKSRTGEFREIAYNPSLQNSVATVRKSTDAAQRTPPDAGWRPLGGVISFPIAAGVC